MHINNWTNAMADKQLSHAETLEFTQGVELKKTVYVGLYDQLFLQKKTN